MISLITYSVTAVFCAPLFIMPSNVGYLLNTHPPRLTGGREGRVDFPGTTRAVPTLDASIQTSQHTNGQILCLPPYNQSAHQQADALSARLYTDVDHDTTTRETQKEKKTKENRTIVPIRHGPHTKRTIQMTTTWSICMQCDTECYTAYHIIGLGHTTIVFPLATTISPHPTLHLNTYSYIYACNKGRPRPSSHSAPKRESNVTSSSALITPRPTDYRTPHPAARSLLIPASTLTEYQHASGEKLCATTNARLAHKIQGYLA